MEKEVVTMSNWEVYIWKEGEYNLSGIADSHPALGRNVFVRYTSHLSSYCLADDILTYETENTIYKCPLKYMNTHPYWNVTEDYKKILTHRGEDSDSCLDKIIAAAAKIALGQESGDALACHILELAPMGQKELEEQKKADDERMFEIAKNYEDCIYIEVSNPEEGDKLAYHIGGRFGVVMPQLHVGMMQDSVLYMKYGRNEDDEDDTELDFRYFPRGFGSMETYRWSDNIQYAVIKNEQKEDAIWFNKCEVAAGETKVFTPELKRR